ncbi:hypothetical protein HYFRA_00012526 [Hymenoscyphus fraxineus]|uniref:Uncharacterized protein n=1 Tax=Hymenoscyphus fraxineus TaxID=746836 RepID=A0A9N9L3H1_9HELO|nr:hypothetical protein HYFRA_00012526 [Hymenoscyphus fraxineus]
MSAATQTIESDGKVAIITGCASGVGLATTIRFLSSKYYVLAVDINELDYAKLGDVSTERLHFYRGNLLADGETDKVIKLCTEKFGPKLDVLANVAGIADGLASADKFYDDEWDRVIGVNLTVPTRLIRGAIPLMRANGGGSIVNVGSKSSTSGAVAGVAYTASKHGMLGVTRSTAFHFRNEGIRCNSVSPGSMLKNSLLNGSPRVLKTSAFDRSVPVFGLGDMEGIKGDDVANAIFFLSSDGAKSISGVDMPLDKAWSTL